MIVGVNLNNSNMDINDNLSQKSHIQEPNISTSGEITPGTSACSRLQQKIEVVQQILTLLEQTMATAKSTQEKVKL